MRRTDKFIIKSINSVIIFLFLLAKSTNIVQIVKLHSFFYTFFTKLIRQYIIMCNKEIKICSMCRFVETCERILDNEIEFIHIYVYKEDYKICNIGMILEITHASTGSHLDWKSVASAFANLRRSK